MFKQLILGLTPNFLKVTCQHLIIYADSPVVFKNPITHFIEILETNDIVLLVDGNRKKNNVRKSGDLIQKKYVEHFNLNYDVFSKKDHLSACFMMFKNNDISKKFVKQWLHNCETGLLDTPLYEQTMMLITSYSLPEGIYFTDNHEIRSFVNNVHRHPNEEDKSLIPEIISKSIGWFKVSRFGYNSTWMRYIRSLIRKQKENCN